MELKYGKLSSFTINNVEYKDIEFEYFCTQEKDKKPTMLILHALTFDSSIHNYWKNFFGNNKMFDTNKYNIVCITSLGHTSGSFGPNSIYNDKRIGEDFPQLTVDDLARFQYECINELKVKNIDVIVGTSMGGMVGWNLISTYKNLANKFIMIGSLNKVGVEMFVQNTIALDILRLDPSEEKHESLKLCRKLALIQYQTFEKNFDRFDANEYNSYLEYNANKFSQSFDYVSYNRLVRAMNQSRHDSYLENVKPSKNTKILVIGIDQDRTFYVQEQQKFVNSLLSDDYNVSYEVINDLSGHDSFLISHEKYISVISKFLKEN